MVDDGIYGEKHKIPIPDIVLGQHVLTIKAGTVGLAAGPVLTAVDSLSIRIWGRGGHGSSAQKCIDPVLTAAHIVIRLQSIVRTEAAPSELAVLSVGSIRAGDASNVIPDFADIKLTIRSYLPHVHERMLGATHRIVRAECDACEFLQKSVYFMPLNPANHTASFSKLAVSAHQNSKPSCMRQLPLTIVQVWISSQLDSVHNLGKRLRLWIPI